MNTRTRLTILPTLLLLSVAGVYGEGSQVLYPAMNRQTLKGPEAWFTGDVQVVPLFPANETARYSGAYVTFQPGARTRWHLHSAGQHMIVTSGVGLGGIVAFIQRDMWPKLFQNYAFDAWNPDDPAIFLFAANLSIMGVCAAATYYGQNGLRRSE